MKWKVMMMLLINFAAPATAQDCISLSEAPASLSMSVRDGNNSVKANKILGKGKTFSQSQWSQKITFRADSFAVSIAPLASCASGLEISVDDSGAIYKRVVAWDTMVTISGSANSSHYVEVMASRIKP